MIPASMASKSECLLSTHCGHSPGSYPASVTNEVRDSLKLWGGGLAIAGLIWLASQSTLFDGLIAEAPADWFWLVVGFLALLNLARFGWGLWERRAANPHNPNRR